MNRQDLPSLAIFVAVAGEGGFRAAARRLGLSVSAVSHAVTTLEANIGARLLMRTTRSVALTPAGERLLREARPALDTLAEAVEAAGASQGHIAGTLRLTVPRSAADLLLVPLTARFMRRFPAVTVELHVDDGFVDIVAQGYDAGVRLGESLELDMVAVPLGGRQRSAVVCAPDVLKSRAMPRVPADLRAFPCIQRRFAGGGLYRWEFEKDGAALDLAFGGGPVLNDDALMLQAALAGAGVAMAFEAAAEVHIAAGRLTRMLEDWCPAFPGFRLYYPDRRLMRPALRAFVDFVRREAGSAAALA